MSNPHPLTLAFRALTAGTGLIAAKKAWHSLVDYQTNIDLDRIAKSLKGDVPLPSGIKTAGIPQQTLTHCHRDIQNQCLKNNHMYSLVTQQWAAECYRANRLANKWAYYFEIEGVVISILLGLIVGCFLVFVLNPSPRVKRSSRTDDQGQLCVEENHKSGKSSPVVP
ncbi:MAG: hypothetical protein Q9162_002694 [Coniocarpon cinnabarinum]